MTLVTTADEMAALVVEPVETRGGVSPEHSDEARLHDALSTRAGRSVAELASRAGLSVAATQAALGVLEIEGRAREGERGWMRARPPAE